MDKLLSALTFEGRRSRLNPSFVAGFTSVYVEGGLSNVVIAAVLDIFAGRVSQIAKQLGLSRHKGCAVSEAMRKPRVQIDEEALQAFRLSDRKNDQLVGRFCYFIETLRTRALTLGQDDRKVPPVHKRDRHTARKTPAPQEATIEARLRATGGSWRALTKIAGEMGWTCSQARRPCTRLVQAAEWRRDQALRDW